MLKQLEEKLEGLIRKRAAELLNDDYYVVAATVKGLWERVGKQYPHKVGNYEIRDVLAGVISDINVMYEYITENKDIETRSGTGVVYGHSQSMKGIAEFYIGKATDQIMAETFSDYEAEFKEEEPDPDPEETYQLTVKIIGKAGGYSGPALVEIYPLLAGKIKFQPNADIAWCKMDVGEAIRCFPFIRHITWSRSLDDRIWNHVNWRVQQWHFNLALGRPGDKEPEVTAYHIVTRLENHVRLQHCTEFAGDDSQEKFLKILVEHLGEEVVRFRTMSYIE